MHRIDEDANVNNLFSMGDPGLGIPATMIGADWLNAVQEEIAEVIEERGISLVKANHGQLKQALGSRKQVSVSSGLYSTNSSSWVATGISLVLASTGRPVLLLIQPDGSTGTLEYGDVACTSAARLGFYRDGTLIAQFGLMDNENLAPGSFHFLDVNASAGSHTYEIRVWVVGGAGTLHIHHSQLVAAEL